MRAVIDTNIFLAAALAIAAGKHTGAREVFEELLPSGLFEHITSTPILYEIGDVLSRSELGVPAAMVEPFIAQIETLSIVVPIRNLSMGIADRKDDKFLETAV
jgi:predicted nucleic acid-binding protein